MHVFAIRKHYTIGCLPMLKVAPVHGRGDVFIKSGASARVKVLTIAGR